MNVWLWTLIALTVFLAVPITIGHYLRRTLDYYDHENELDP